MTKTPLRTKLQLLPRPALVVTGPVDKADWNYRPLLGWLQRRRFALAMRLLPQERVGTLLEIGYGSGVFMPTLHQYCDQLLGVDIHELCGPVSERLADHQVAARLFTATAENLPFADASIDCAVAISSLEFVDDASAAARELQRVLKPQGSLVVITPGKSPLVDLGLRLLTGASAKHDYAGRRERLLPALAERFDTVRQLTFPWPSLGLILLYSALALRPRQGRSDESRAIRLHSSPSQPQLAPPVRG